MKTVDIDEVPEAATNSPADVVRLLSSALSTEELAINWFELAPDQQLGYAYHRHLDQEEVFSVQRGTVTFETESGEVEVTAGELVRFEPGEFQLGRNRGDEQAHVLALGAPRESTEIEYRLECPTCDDETIQTPEFSEESMSILIYCTDCESTTDEIALD